MAGIPESLGGGGPQRDTELSSLGPAGKKPRLVHSREQSDDGIWTIRDSEIFLTRHVEPMIRRTMGEAALTGSFSVHREAVVRGDDAEERFIADIERGPGWPLSVTVQMVAAESLSDAELLVQWPSIQKTELAEKLGLVLGEDDDDEDGELPPCFPEDICDEPITAYVNKTIKLTRGQRPTLSLMTGFLYLDDAYCSYDQVYEVHEASRQGRPLADTPEEHATLTNMSRHLLHHIEYPEVKALRRALGILGITNK